MQKHHPPSSTQNAEIQQPMAHSTPILHFADEQTAEEEEHVARNHWASFDNSPKILPWPAIKPRDPEGRLTKLRCHGQGPSKAPRYQHVCFNTNDTKAHVDSGSQIPFHPFPRAVHEDPQNGRAVDSVPGQCCCSRFAYVMWLSMPSPIKHKQM